MIPLSRFSISRRKTRIVTFRVSEEEFQQLRRTCAAAGVRSVSDFVRAALRRMTSDGPAAQPPARVQSIQEGWYKTGTGTGG